jgi:hypothetical protein
MVIQMFAAWMCYIFGKFACKILIQGFSYAFPVNLTIPVSVSLLIAACGIRNGDPCAFYGTLPDYLFFESPPSMFDDFCILLIDLLLYNNFSLLIKRVYLETNGLDLVAVVALADVDHSTHLDAEM